VNKIKKKYGGFSAKGSTPIRQYFLCLLYAKRSTRKKNAPHGVSDVTPNTKTSSNLLCVALFLMAVAMGVVAAPTFFGLICPTQS
jgi:hypothetical protein